jgi:hypothetical protein
MPQCLIRQQRQGPWEHWLAHEKHGQWGADRGLANVLSLVRRLDPTIDDAAVFHAVSSASAQQMPTDSRVGNHLPKSGSALAQERSLVAHSLELCWPQVNRLAATLPQLVSSGD